MFIRKENEQSVNDFVEKEAAKAVKHKSIEDQLFEREMAEIEKTVQEECDKKRKGFSFEILENVETEAPEVVELESMIQKAVDNYRFLRKMGQEKEAMEIKSKIADIKFAKAHLVMVLNMDFTRPTT